jgi:hypothetical protein
MEKHERGCTANPNRICGLCEHAVPPLKQKTTAELIACLSWDKDEYGMKELRELTEGCPSCILSGRHQHDSLQPKKPGRFHRNHHQLGVRHNGKQHVI